ncbi:endoribonuclease Dicer homolog 2-like isoform X2 [Diospyros lotus]|uniref:endoribonuclease Dicer homolog 2-like isoform X2 n=1 Tax=Diospyros lotus TaxID=55363 RepID=UPI00225594B0|nr:endoribonuclease Dicer homolog 2-like isoform X2 [Diospyros lotus]
MTASGRREILSGPLPFARSYQMEALAKAIKQNTIVFLGTGSGKMLISIMLLHSYADLLQKPSHNIGVFLKNTHSKLKPWRCTQTSKLANIGERWELTIGTPESGANMWTILRR